MAAWGAAGYVMVTAVQRGGRWAACPWAQFCTQGRVWAGDTEGEEATGTRGDRDKNCLQCPSDPGVRGGRRRCHYRHREPELEPQQSPSGSERDRQTRSCGTERRDRWRLTQAAPGAQSGWRLAGDSEWTYLRGAGCERRAITHSQCLVVNFF